MYFVVILLLLFFISGKKDELKVVSSGDKVICKLHEWKSWIEFRLENETVAQSITQSSSCDVSPNYKEYFSISCNKEMYVFELKVKKLPDELIGRKLFCTDGTNSDFIVLKAKGKHNLFTLMNHYNGVFHVLV